MKTRGIKGNDEENIEVITAFVTLDAVAYIRCNHCELPMYTSNLYIWKEDKDGKPYGLHLVHYKCQEPFVRTHKGKWFGKGMPSPKIKW